METKRVIISITATSCMEIKAENRVIERAANLVAEEISDIIQNALERNGYEDIDICYDTICD